MRITIRGGILAMIAVVLSAALTSCGGGSDEEPLTKEQFTKRATLVCNEGEREREEALATASKKFEESEGGDPREAQEEAVLAVVAAYEGMTDRFAELSPPEGDEKKVEAIVGAMEESADKITANPEAAIKGQDVFGKPNELLADYGLKGCQA